MFLKIRIKTECEPEKLKNGLKTTKKKCEVVHIENSTIKHKLEQTTKEHEKNESGQLHVTDTKILYILFFIKYSI